MKNIDKKLLLGFLVASNLVVISMVAGLYLTNTSQVSLNYSLAEETVESAVHKKCKKEIDAVIENKRMEYICNVEIEKSKNDEKYTVKIRAQIKNVDGNIKISTTGKVTDTKYDTEAGLCSDCANNIQLSQSSGVNVFQEFVNIANLTESKVESNVVKMIEQNASKEEKKSIALKKEKNCEGVWNELEEDFEAFEIEEQIDCKLKTLNTRSNLYEAEKYFNDSNLKDDMWKIALSDDYDDVSDYLSKIEKSAMMQSLFINHSVNFMKKYIGYKEYLELNESEETTKRIEQALAQLKYEAQALNVNDSFTKDIQYLNQATKDMNLPTVGVPNNGNLSLSTNRLSQPGNIQAPKTKPNKQDLKHLYNL